MKVLIDADALVALMKYSDSNKAKNGTAVKETTKSAPDSSKTDENGAFSD